MSKLEILWDEEVEVIVDDVIPEGEAWLTVETTAARVPDGRRRTVSSRRVAVLRGLGPWLTEREPRP